MPRSKHEAPPIERAAVDHDVVAADTRAADADAPRRAEIVQRYGDGVVYDRLRIVDRAKFYMEQGAVAMLEAGKCLIQIKEFEEHGDFIAIVESLGLHERVARRMMAASVKVLAADEKDRPKLLTMSRQKLYDLTVLDDEEIKELAKGRTVAGITLDEIDAMSTRELRAKLREAQGDLEAKDRLLDQKNKKLDKLTEDGHRKEPWRAAFDKAVKRINQAGDALMLACGDLAKVAEDLSELQLDGVDRDADVLALRAQLANRYYDLSEHLLEQSVGTFVAARGDFIEPLLALARKKLPEEVRDKIFNGSGE
jgi:hypothetical protein